MEVVEKERNLWEKLLRRVKDKLEGDMGKRSVYNHVSMYGHYEILKKILNQGDVLLISIVASFRPWKESKILNLDRNVVLAIIFVLC